MNAVMKAKGAGRGGKAGKGDAAPAAPPAQDRSGVAKSAALAAQEVRQFLREAGLSLAPERMGRPDGEGLTVLRPSPRMVSLGYHVPRGREGPEATARHLAAREQAMTMLKGAGFPIRGAAIVCEGP